VCTPKQTLLLPLQFKLAMPDDQFIFSSSWLPSPRFKLRTLAGYTLQADTDRQTDRQTDREAADRRLT